MINNTPIRKKPGTQMKKKFLSEKTLKIANSLDNTLDISVDGQVLYANKYTKNTPHLL